MNHVLEATTTELRGKLKQYAEQYDWQFGGAAGSNAEARRPEPKARGGNLPPDRSADHDDDEGGDNSVSYRRGTQ